MNYPSQKMLYITKVKSEYNIMMCNLEVCLVLLCNF